MEKIIYRINCPDNNMGFCGSKGASCSIEIKGLLRSACGGTFTGYSLEKRQKIAGECLRNPLNLSKRVEKLFVVDEKLLQRVDERRNRLVEMIGIV